MSDNTVDISFKINGVETAVKSVDQLKSEVNKLEDATKSAEKQQGFFAKRFDDFKSTVKDIGASFGDLKGGFTSMSKGLAGIGKGFGLAGKSANIFGKVTAGAIAATGIGLIIPLVLTLVNYFKNLEGAAKLLDKALAAVGAVVANIGGALKKFFSGDFSGAFKQLSDSVGEAVSAVDDLYEAEKRLNDIKKRTVIENAKLNQEIEAQKKILEDTTLTLDERIGALDKVTAATKQLAENQLAETQAALDGAKAQLVLTNNYEERREKQLEIAELQAQLIEQTTALQNIEYDAERVGREIRTQAAEERKAQAEERLEQEKTVTEAIAALRIEAIEDEQEKALAQFDAMQAKAMEELEANKATAEQKLEAERLFAEQRKAIIDEYDLAEKEKQAAEDEEAEAKRQADLEALNVFLEEARLAKIDDAFLLAQEELRIAEEKALAELELLGATEEQKQQIREMYAKKREKLDQEHNKSKKKLNQQEKDAVLQTTAATFNIIGQMMGENSAAGKAASVASATINTYQAATNALANTPGPPPIPQIAAGIAIASGIMNVKKILSTKTPGPSGGAAAAVAGGVPSAPSIPAVDPSQALGGNIEGETGQNTVTLGEQTGSSSANVVRAYVVSDEMTTQQEADKKINDLARL
jgi:chemotaxis protein histidine kinase CheA